MTALTERLPQFVRNTSRFGPVRLLVGIWMLYRERSALRDLDADRLEDIGVSRRDAVVESTRPVWDAPEFWRR